MSNTGNPAEKNTGKNILKEITLIPSNPDIEQNSENQVV